MNDTIFTKLINDSKLLINKEINAFLYCLFLRIFLRKRNKSISIKTDRKLKIFIDKINKEIIKDKDKEINKEYTFKNLSNIIDFVKTQNTLFSSEIIENLLIVIFSFAFKTEKGNSFEKLLYNNMELIKRMKNSDLINWILLNKFKKEFHGEKVENFEMLLINDFYDNNMNDLNKKDISKMQPIKLFLSNINDNKLKISNNEEKSKRICEADNVTDIIKKDF